ncbi:hypothetical protein BGZ58_009797 [Dissophora ornata]|nr:hypothetical protein BGZ58_009797 [Dissophora ornata]
MDMFSNLCDSSNSNHNKYGSVEVEQQATSLKRSSKRRSVVRPWTNVEQESLYVAVERLKLYGQWQEVKLRMNLDRTVTEIEEEYTRLYAELPDSDDDLIDQDPDVCRDVNLEQSQEDLEAAILTPALTATSSAAPSARSSHEDMSSLFDRTKVPFKWQIPKLRPAEAEDDDELDDEEDGYEHHFQDDRRQHIPIDARPQRTVRVWTQEQSENLKDLIEMYFPGAYRINWAWVASQLGNSFTRKQCKNKWEIMRRRIGSEDEITLLKQGYQEFGPSWGQIQEKYLPERSRGSISIMWNLLETRETEQQKRKCVGHRLGRGVYHGRHHSTPSIRSFQRSYASKESCTVLDFMKAAKHCHQEQASCRQKVSKNEIKAMDIFSSAIMRDRMEEDTQQQLVSRTMEHEACAVHMTRHARHRSDIPSLHSAEAWGDRSYPMTWTEPLSRRLEELVQLHFPNHQKVNWVKISSMMGTNPAVSREQCKRRWYLISQNSGHPPQQLQQGERAGEDYETEWTGDAVEGTRSKERTPI